MPEFSPMMEGWSFPGGCAVLFAPASPKSESETLEHA
jgi:hypothetical protein